MRRWLVRGRVQGVGFRYFVKREASALGLRGVVRNTSDGAVDVVGMGTGEQLDRLEERLLVGPEMAVVDKLERMQPDETDVTRFADSFMIVG